MAWFTEMSGSPTEPLSNWTTEATFEFNIVCTVFWTILDSSSHTHSCTLTTDQLFKFIVLSLHLSLLTILHTSKVRIFTYETLVIREFIYSESFQVIVKSVIFITQSGILIKSFVLSSVNSFIKQVFFHSEDILHFILKYLAVRCFYSLFTRRTLKEVKDYSWARPSLFYFVHDTI